MIDWHQSEARGLRIAPATLVTNSPEGPQILMVGEFGVGNFGNDASAEVMERMLDEAGFRVRRTALSRSSQEGEVTFSLWPPVPEDALPSWLAKSLRRILLPWWMIRLVGSHDAVVVPGMGVLEGELGVRAYGMPWLVFCMTLAGRICRTPTALVAIGVSDSSSLLARMLTRGATHLSNYVSYRDVTSRHAASRSKNVRSRGEVYADIVFALPVVLESHVDVEQSSRTVVGVMRYTGGAGDVVQREKTLAEYGRRLADFVIQIVKRGHTVDLVGGDALDYETALDVWKLAIAGLDEDLQGRVVVCQALNQVDLEEILARANVVVCSRYHNLVGAVRVQRPVISINYAQKSRELVARIGDPCVSFDLHDTSGAGWLEAFDRVYEGRSEAADDAGRLFIEASERSRAQLSDFHRWLEARVFPASQGGLARHA